jgi:hypothetical protein
VKSLLKVFKKPTAIDAKLTERNIRSRMRLRQQAYDYHEFVKQQPKMKKTDIPVSELPSV